MITKAEPKDIEALNILINSAYRGETSKQGWPTEVDLLLGLRTDTAHLRDRLARDNCTLLTYINDAGQVIGCVRLEKQNDQLYLGMLTVAPQLQGKDIGKQ